MELTASEVYVNDEGYARDDEGNTWFVGKQHAGWFGNFSQARRALPSPPSEDSYPSRPRKQRLPSMSEREKKEHRETAAKLIIALISKNDQRAMKFVKDVTNTSSLTPKQESYFDSLVKRHQRVIDQLPTVSISWAGGGTPQLRKKSLSDSDRKKIERVVDLFDLGMGDFDYLTIRALGKAPKPKPQPSGGNTKQLAVFDTLLGRMPNNSFLKSLRDQVSRGRTLSQAQLKAVRQTLYKNRMKEEADLFRQAGRRIAADWLSKESQKTGGS